MKLVALFKFSILVSVVVFLGGCGSSQVHPDAKHKAPKYISLQKASRAEGECPRSEKGWRKLHARQLMKVANLCVVQKQWGQVDMIGEHLAGLLPEAPWGAFYMSVGSQGLERYPRALWMADLAVKKSPRTGFIHYQKSRVLWSMGEYELSVKVAEDSLKADPHLVDARYFLAQVYFRDRELKKAREHFQALTKVSASDASGYIGLAETYLAAGDNSAAIRTFENAVNLAPSDLPLRLRMGEVYEGEKMVVEALHTYRKAHALAKTNKRHAQTTAELSEKIELLEKLVQTADSKVSLRVPAEEGAK